MEKKLFRLSWEKTYDKSRIFQLRVIFNRVDGVTIKEIIEAMNSVKEEKLLDLYANGGSVMIYCAGGMPLTGISLKWYLQKREELKVLTNNV